MVEVIQGEPQAVALKLNKIEHPHKVIGFSVVTIKDRAIAYAMVEHFHEIIEDDSNREYVGYHPYTEDPY